MRKFETICSPVGLLTGIRNDTREETLMQSERVKRDSPRADMRDADMRDHGSDSSPRVCRLESPSHYNGAIGEALGRAAAAPGTPQAERLDALIAAVEDYEQRHGHDIAEHEKLSVSIRRMRSAVGIE
jgi:hypothetical protein